MDKSENELKIEERRHSLTWHQNVVKKKYEEFISSCESAKKWDSNGNIVPFEERQADMPLYQYYLDIGYSFLDIFADTYCNYRKRKDFYLSPDQVKLPEQSDFVRTFNLLRLDYFKTLNLIDTMIMHICDNNVDTSVFKFGFNSARAREAFIWLMCTTNKPEFVDVQDINRLKTFYKVQINRCKKSQNKYYDHSNIEKEYSGVRDSLERGGGHRQIWRKNKIKALEIFKNELQVLINDIFDVYEIISVYRDYLVDTEKETDSKDIYSIQGALVMADTIKQIFLERFVCYAKIPNLSLGHSELVGAQFTRSDISHSNFINSVFKYARLDNAVAADCDFSISDFTKCDAKGATLNDCTFNYSNMSGMDLSGATLKNSLLDAVIFRDNQLDNTIEYATDLLNNNNKWIAAFEKRIRELDNIRDQSLLHPEDETEQIFTKLYSQLSRDSVDKTLWKMTCAKEEDVYPHILTADECGNIEEGNKTVFDEIFYEVRNRMNSLVEECSAKVISEELLKLLREAEAEESSESRAARFSHFGSICFEPTLLRGANIIGSSLPQIDLSHIDMSNASLEKCDMSGAIGYYTKAKTAYFGGTNINGGEFYCCDFNDTNFSKSNCINSVFLNCGLHALNMNGALCVGITIVNTYRDRPFLSDLLKAISSDDNYNRYFKNLSENIRDDEYLSEERIDLSDSNWNNASAARSKFFGMKMDRSYFSQTDLSNFLIFDCAVRWSLFEKADVSYGLLLGTSFHQSIFHGTTLSQSHVFACEFSGCRMTNMVFIGARCDKVIFYDNDMENANFSRGLFNNCVFRSCDFKKLNISKSKFVHCVFYNVDFKDCVGLNSAYFEECIFDNVASFENAADNNDLLDETAEIMSLNGNKVGDNVKVEAVKRSKSNNNLYTTSNSRSN